MLVMAKVTSVLDGTVRETQLFNLADNPHELLKEHGSSDPALTNLAGRSEYAAKQAEMEALLLAEMRRLDDPYRLWNQPNDGLKPQPESTTPAKKKKRKSSAN
ncbi:MAG TPA: hypothetical protein VHY91_14885 [Pirellulales bacterium]|jgi:hypothetical protein|nr:hypothetical protein [Pirellulales bacterium]